MHMLFICLSVFFSWCVRLNVTPGTSMEAVDIISFLDIFLQSLFERCLKGDKLKMQCDPNIVYFSVHHKILLGLGRRCPPRVMFPSLPTAAGRRDGHFKQRCHLISELFDDLVIRMRFCNIRLCVITRCQ